MFFDKVQRICFEPCLPSHTATSYFMCSARFKFPIRIRQLLRGRVGMVMPSARALSQVTLVLVLFAARKGLGDSGSVYGPTRISI